MLKFGFPDFFILMIHTHNQGVFVCVKPAPSDWWNYFVPARAHHPPLYSSPSSSSSYLWWGMRQDFWHSLVFWCIFDTETSLFQGTPSSPRLPWCEFSTYSVFTRLTWLIIRWLREMCDQHGGTRQHQHSSPQICCWIARVILLTRHQGQLRHLTNLKMVYSWHFIWCWCFPSGCKNLIVIST